jgi:hypothetical protein
VVVVSVVRMMKRSKVRSPRSVSVKEKSVVGRKELNLGQSKKLEFGDGSEKKVVENK